MIPGVASRRVDSRQRGSLNRDLQAVRQLSRQELLQRRRIHEPYLGHGSLMCATTSSESSIRTTENTDVGLVPPSATTAAFDVRTVCLKYP
jgi:hypothetical protein